MKLLIVDDHPVNLKLLRAQLESDAHSVLEAANGVEALRVMERERVDGIISDILMPEIDGFRLCLEVRKRNALAGLPFVFYTATYSSPQDRELAANVGADAYLLKPAPVRDIVDAVLAAARTVRPAGDARPAETDVLKRYSAALVTKLEQRNLELEEAMSKLREAEAHYRLLFDSAPIGITLTGPDGSILSANPAIARMLGFRSADEVIAELGGMSRDAYADEGARQAYVDALRQSGGDVKGFEVRLRRSDGSLLWASLTGRVVPDPQGAGSLLVTMIDDISLRKEQDARIARLSRVKAMRSGINAAMMRTRARKVLLGEACRIAVTEGGVLAAWVGWHDRDARRIVPLASAGRLEGMLDRAAGPIEAAPGEEASISARVLQGGVAIATEDMRSSPGVRYRNEALERGYLSAMHLPLNIEGRTEGVLVLYAGQVGFFDDEEQRLLKELAADVSFAVDSLAKSERLDYLAYYDVLTGLPNRSLFHDRLAQSLQNRQGERVLTAVVLIDLERFQRVNATAGRDAGDELLRTVGGRLRQANDTAARIGVNLYALRLRGARNAADVGRVAEAIVAACFGEPFQVKGQELRIACRVGIALHPADGADAEELLRNAETALDRSKRNGEPVMFYAAEMNARVAEALSMENRLRRALEREEFLLHYQPKVRVSDGSITGVEALIRWQDPAHGLVPPGRFIPVLEETGLIVDVGRWVLARALADMRAWMSRGVDVKRIAINVSAAQLRRKDFDAMVIDAVSSAGDIPERLELEITESLLMHDVEHNIRKLMVLRGMGITVSMDDFGTGYSSLSYLARLPLDKVKIDRSFVMGIVDDAESAAIVAGIIALVHSLKLPVIAEGVETAEQAAHLAALGCDEAQGYLYSRPLPADKLVEFVQAGSLRP